MAEGAAIRVVAASGSVLNPSRTWPAGAASLHKRHSTAQPLPGTDNADYRFWSPDSRSIAFADGGKLKKIDIPGGPAQTLCDIPGVMRGGAWNNDGVTIFGITAAGLYRVSSSGGAAVPLTTIEPGEISHRGPSFLPDGRHFLFLETAKRIIYVSSLDNTKDRKLLRNSASTAAYAAPAARL